MCMRERKRNAGKEVGCECCRSGIGELIRRIKKVQRVNWLPSKEGGK